MSRKVLILTYYFPPAGGVAVQRFLKFSKYMPQNGWQPIIVTVKNGSYPFTDESLLKEIPSEVQVYRTPTFEPFEFYNLLRGKKGKAMPTVSVGGSQNKTWFQSLSEYIRANFFIPDARKGWVPYAVKQALEIIQQEKPDVLITTGPPHSTHLAGLELKKKTGIKWVADFRDPWTNNLMNEHLPRTSGTIQKDKQLEDAVLMNADAVTVISEGMKSEFADRNNRVQVVYNGFDENDFEVQPITTPGVFTLRHIGNLILTMNVPALWQAISELLKEDAGFRQYFRLEIIGGIHDSVKSEFRKYEIEPVVKYVDFVNHPTAIAYMKGANLLLFLVSNVKHSELLMSGKVFEYLGSRGEILSIGPVNGNAAALLRQCHRSPMIDFDNKVAMKEQLAAAFHRWLKEQNRFEYPGTEHLFYSRQEQCKVLAQLINHL